jgi:NgoFVII restriction endonuclease
VITKDLFNEVLIKPVKDGADKLLIVSGYATSAMAFHHLEAVRRAGLSVEVDLIVGMPPQDGLSLSNHKGFQKIVEEDYSGKFSCSYVYNRPSVHSKVYTWLNRGKPVISFVGSANYSQNAFLQQREALVRCDPGAGMDYFSQIHRESIHCTHAEVENQITIYSDNQYINRIKRKPEGEGRDSAAPFEVYAETVEANCVRVSFLDKRGNLPDGASGLNWAFRPGKFRNNLNEAYIQLPPAVYKSDFFPIRGTHFTVLTDDGKSLICTRAQKDQFGHAIETPQNNGLLGEYFRYRMGLAYGHRVTKEDLEAYGRTDVEFCKVDDETYEMDFSV